MTVGMSEFTRAGDCKSVPAALAERAAAEPLRITLLTGASLGHDTDKLLAQAGVLARRMPFQVDTTLRRKINQGEIAFVDQHLSETVEQLRAGHIGPIDIAIVEAAAITEDGGIVPTMSVGNSASFVEQARLVIVELNLGVPAAIEGLHDIVIPGARPGRQPCRWCRSTSASARPASRWTPTRSPPSSSPTNRTVPQTPCRPTRRSAPSPATSSASCARK